MSIAWGHSFQVVEENDEIRAVSMWTEEEVRQPLDYADETRRKRLSRSQPFRIDWGATLGLAICVLSALFVIGLAYWIAS